jgi:hypothetical protein
MSQPISMSAGGPPETVLPPESTEIRHLVDQVWKSATDSSSLLSEAELLVQKSPRSSAAWAAVGVCTTSTIGKYAAFRVGYHRGLDALRANGWRGSGFVRWTEAGNVGFLRCLLGLAVMAHHIGEDDEATRCEQFLLQLDPRGVPAEERTRISASLGS